MCSDVGFISVKMAGGSYQGDCHPGRVCPVRRAPDPGNVNFLQGDLPPKRSLRKERRQSEEVPHGEAKGGVFQEGGSGRQSELRALQGH